MMHLLDRFRPSLPPVAVFLEAPSILALRVAKPGKVLQALVRHEDQMTAVVDALASGEEGGSRLADMVLTRLGRPKRLSLIMGDPFFRMQIVSLNDFPRREEERHQVIMWHLRKTLNVPVDTLRLRYHILQKTPGSVTLWLSLCQEDGVVAIEKAFADQGCEVGYVGAASVELHNLVLASGLLPDEGPALLLNRTPNYLSFLFTEGGQPVFFRCKETVPEEVGDSRIEQELRLTIAYHREKLGYGKLRKVILRRSSEGLPVSLEGVMEDDIPVLDLGSEPPIREGWSPLWLPLVGLMEGA